MRHHLLLLLFIKLCACVHLREQVLDELTSNGALLRSVVDLIVEKLERDNLAGEQGSLQQYDSFETRLEHTKLTDFASSRRQN